MLTHRHWRVVQQQKQFRWRVDIYWIVLLCSLTVLLTACSKFHPAQSGSQTPTTIPTLLHTVLVTPTVTLPTITLQVIGCPSGLSLNWDSLVGTKANVNKVEKVLCGNLEGNGALQAVVNVRYYSPDAKSDCYVYDNITGTPVQRFSALGLLHGDAQISTVGTLMTAEVGAGDSVKSVQDIFKEYQWNPSNATFVQLLFPGMYPNTNHYQAEQDQAQLNAEIAAGDKHDAWKATFYGVVDNLAKHIFYWTNFSTSTVRYSLSTGTYIAAVTNLEPSGGGFIASMFHLDGVTSNIYEVAQVTSLDGSALLNNPTAGLQVSNPVNASGSSFATGTTLGHIVIYNDLYNKVGDSGAISSSISSGQVNFTKSVTYQLNAKGLQEGMVAFYATNQNSILQSKQVVMVKVFLSA